MATGDNVSNLILEHLKRLQAGLSRIERTQEEHTLRLGRIENTLGRLQSQHEEDYALHSTRIDRLNERILRIERRLELIDDN